MEMGGTIQRLDSDIVTCCNTGRDSLQHAPHWAAYGAESPIAVAGDVVMAGT